MCQGASAGEKTAQAGTQATAKALQQDFNTVFGTNQNILTGLTDSLTPLATNPYQFGMSLGEEMAERTQAADQIAAQSAQTSQAVNEALASRGITPGAGVSPGAIAEVEASIAENAAQQNSTAQLGITQQGYQMGQENYWKATSALAAAPGELENPAAQYGKEATTAYGQDFSQANTINQQDNAWKSQLAGAVGAGLSLIPGVGPVIGAATSALGGNNAVAGNLLKPPSPNSNSGFNNNGPNANGGPGEGGYNS